jgi:hypothetical protein
LPARIPPGLHGSWIAGQSIPHETTPPAPQAGLAVTHEGVVMTLASNMGGRSRSLILAVMIFAVAMAFTDRCCSRHSPSFVG